MHVMQGDNADTIWQKAADLFRDGRTATLQPGRRGPALELLNATLVLGNPRQRWVASRQPAINPAFAIVELVWILSGRQDSKFINDWNREYARLAGHGEIYHGAYGNRLRHHFRLDQLDRAFHALEANSEGRQVVLQIWDPEVDLPDNQGRPVAADVPCSVCSIVKIRNGRLEWLQIVRSNDFYKGLPYDLVHWTTIQEIIAGWLGVQLGSYVHIAHSLHVYMDDMGDVTKSEPREVLAKDVDTMNSSKQEWNHLARLMENTLEEMAGPSVSESRLLDLANPSGVPRPILNWLAIIGAESARRRRWGRLMRLCAGRCTNPALSQMWDHWLSRFGSRPSES